MEMDNQVGLVLTQLNSCSFLHAEIKNHPDRIVFGCSVPFHPGSFCIQAQKRNNMTTENNMALFLVFAAVLRIVGAPFEFGSRFLI